LFLSPVVQFFSRSYVNEITNWRCTELKLHACFFFYIDGKFILELSHRKDGDRTSWVPVPKKTYWPPPAAAGTPRQESSTSLSGIVHSVLFDYS
jgi:hypothetical protein